MSRSAGPVVGRSAGRSSIVVVSVGRLVGRLVGRSVGSSAGRSAVVRRRLGRSVGRSIRSSVLGQSLLLLRRARPLRDFHAQGVEVSRGQIRRPPLAGANPGSDPDLVSQAPKIPNGIAFALLRIRRTRRHGTLSSRASWARTGYGCNDDEDIPHAPISPPIRARAL